MGNILENISLFLSQYHYLSYFLVALMLVIQGETGVLISMYLVVGHAMRFSTFIVIAIISLLIFEGLIFWLGRTLRNTKMGFWLEKRIPYHNIVQDYLSNNMTQFVILSKFLLGLNTPVIFFSGWAKIEFKQFIKAHIVGILIWLLVVVPISFFLVLGLDYLRGAKIFKEIEIGILFFIALILFSQHLLKKFLTSASRAEGTAKKLGKFLRK